MHLVLRAVKGGRLKQAEIEEKDPGSSTARRGAPYALALAPSRGAAPRRSRVRRRYTPDLPCVAPDC
eukprot:COSAG06_NODE_18193_length_899_cov_1.045000_1_plen_67_part_00